MKLAAFSFLAALACAHPLPVTGVVVHADASSTSVTVTAHLPALEGADPAFEIPRRLHLRLDGEAFSPKDSSVERDSVNDTVTWTAREDRHASAIAVEAPLFPERPGDTTAVLIYRGERLSGTMALTPAHPSGSEGERLFSVIRRFISMGIFHILSGPDHILFVLGLILAGGSTRQLCGVVTAFTLAHSLTLSLTALGIASLSPRVVEPVIAFSIVVVGLENLLRRKPLFPLRIGLAFGFGFFHGFGFAGALAEAGLPAHAIGWSLASFNTGVEIGQGFILLVVLPVLFVMRQKNEHGSRLFTQFASVAIALAGAVWFADRLR